MATKVRIEHISKGYMEIWKSDAMQSLVDSTGQRIALEAGEGFKYYPKPGNFTAMGFVSSTGREGALAEQEDRALSRAVHI